MVKSGSSNESDGNSGKRPLRPRARLLRTIGEELIDSETTAVLEIVKNSYDADATRVLIRFSSEKDDGEATRVEVLDDGHGMSLDTILSAWLEPSTSIKKYEKRSKIFGRRVLGEKGVGRFASSKIAKQLFITSREKGSMTEAMAFFDWSEFEDDEKYLDEVPIEWFVGPARVFTSGGDAASLWAVFEKYKQAVVSDEAIQLVRRRQGTLLEMTFPKSTWGQEEYRRLRIGLSRLVSPFLYTSRDDETEQVALQVDAREKDRFEIILDLPEKYSEFNGQVDPPPLVQNPFYVMDGKVAEDGTYTGEFRYWTGQGKEYETEKISGDVDLRDASGSSVPYTAGPFSYTFRVWDRDRESLERLTGSYQEARKDLDDVTGVNIYRDGFRILPYGEKHNDWLRLDNRRVQKPGIRISNNQIVGYISISADENKELIDQSHRQGMIINSAYEKFQQAVLSLITSVEARRHALRRGNDELINIERPPGLFNDITVSSLRDFVQANRGDDQALLEAISNTEKRIETNVRRAQEVLARYQRHYTLGQLVDKVLHDGRDPLSKIKGYTDNLRQDVASAQEYEDGANCIKLLPSISTTLTRIMQHGDRLSGLFRSIEPFSGRKRGRPADVVFEDIIKSVFDLYSSELKHAKVAVDLPSTKHVVRVDQGEIQIVVVNLLLNSLYWLNTKGWVDRRIYVRVNRPATDQLTLCFSDSGPGVDPTIRGSIFDPYFSTSKKGTGLGLSIVGDIIGTFYDGDVALLDSGPLPGATFQVTLRKRVDE